MAEQEEARGNTSTSDNGRIVKHRFFGENVRLVATLMHLMPAQDRVFIRKWLEKLCTPWKTQAEHDLQNDFIHLLLVQIEGGRLTLPFTNTPPATLKAVAKSVDVDIYRQTLSVANRRVVPGYEERQATPSVADRLSRSARLGNFADTQPIPSIGFICYGCCFSNYDSV